MGKITGFLEVPREGPQYRPVAVRLRDWHEVYVAQSDEEIAAQGSRCMDCGIPFCMQGCPLGNRIPAFNDAAYHLHWELAAEQLFATNNFPEFTGRLCPAPCESACVLGINSDPVTIERLEYEVAEHAFTHGVAVAYPTPKESGKRVAIVGSGPAGLAAAAQLRSVGHAVSVFERSDAIGGLLRYGIPEFKMEKSVLDRRLDVMRGSGVEFFPGVTIGMSGTALSLLREDFDAVLLAIGSTRPRLIPVPGAELEGIVPAMTYLEASNRAVNTGTEPKMSAEGLHVVILGGGDTGADCLGTVHRQGAASVAQIEIMDRPPDVRSPEEPWPTMPRLYKTTSAHAEGGERRFSSETLEFRGHERVESLVLIDHVNGESLEVDADLVLIAAGFIGPEVEDLEMADQGCLTSRATFSVDGEWRVKGVPGAADLFACGDAVRGQSLIVWAIAEGRSAAAAIDASLMHHDSPLSAPVAPYSLSW
ncbi:MAG: glutamate synthase subunit beta [Acidimicrobiales bacterium]